jgi:hypothetical protein
MKGWTYSLRPQKNVLSTILESSFLKSLIKFLKKGTNIYVTKLVSLDS